MLLVPRWSRTSATLGAIALTLTFAGCRADDDYPLQPGDGTGTGKPMKGADAGVDGGTSAHAVAGKVCVVTDLRQPAACSPNGNVGVSVRESGTSNQTVTTAGGAFSLPVTAMSVAVIEVGVGNTALAPSLVALPVGQTSVEAPVPLATEFQAVLDATTGAPPATTGTLAMYFVQGRASLAGVVVLQPTEGLNAPVYDIATSPRWLAGGVTGPYGAALLVGVQADTIDVVATGPAQEDLTVRGVRMAGDHVTFVTVQAPSR